MIVFQNGRRFIEYRYEREDEFERDILDSHGHFFGKDTIYIDAKRKIGSQSLGKAIPDGFLFDMSDPDNRQFYLVEVELAGHDFYKHIFPQITKFFAFFKDTKRQRELVEKLFSTINGAPELRERFRSYLGTQETFKFLSDLVDSSQNILLVIDGDKPELPEITDTYSDTWGKMVKVLTIKKYMSEGDSVFTVHPEFDAIEYSVEGASPDEETEEVSYSEEFHLEGVGDNVKAIYRTIKERVREIDASFVLNPQKYYISIKGTKNLVFMLIRKKKISLVILLPEEEIRSKIKDHNVKTLSDSVQGFYNAPCAAVDVSNLDNIDEVVDLIRILMKQNSA